MSPINNNPAHDLNALLSAAKDGDQHAFAVLKEIKNHCANSVRHAEKGFPGIYKDALLRLDERKRERALTALVDMLDYYGDAVLYVNGLAGEASK